MLSTIMMAQRSSVAAWLLGLVSLLALSLPSQALYFYMDGQTPMCFYEELPKDTLVVGDFTAALFNQDSQAYDPRDDLGLLITVEETFDNDHRVVSQRANKAQGRFIFTAADAGVHRICFSASNAPGGGWLSSGQGAIKFTLDLAIGETSQIESTDKGTVDELAHKLRDLNSRLHDIRREQVFQREREAEFRNQSELVNSRVVKWTIIQLVILGITCAWQLSHLRSFFIKQKLT